jgi:hypothetical protein
MKGMVKQATGLFLLGVMALLITLKHPAFSYCQCLEALGLAGCECKEEVVVAPECGSTCCPSQTEEVCETGIDPDDCMVSLAYDAGEFVQTEHFKFVDLALVAEMQPTEYLLVDSYPLETLAPARGSPDPPPIADAPLYIRHSVYLL